jgi:hypothetical protein
VHQTHQTHDHETSGQAPDEKGEVVAAHRRGDADRDHQGEAEGAALDLVGAHQQAHLAGQR